MKHLNIVKHFNIVNKYLKKIVSEKLSKQRKSKEIKIKIEKKQNQPSEASRLKSDFNSLVSSVSLNCWWPDLEIDLEKVDAFYK